ncbi:hypothetical protein [Haloarchaeobius iranensis]|uniref:MYM-type Zinc finger with FCS sequence motif-containing protein n=1 Tax=Haloarchaeobius iranensis TaxID=996166 RepID=A0A1G9TA69_9EURY|nr:hypothetical protein [Haloarchaeobius iranensis]SDM44550.1 hypothetical protein SAMN05192554_102229 [Haloarchaeobius iranensis]
MSTPCVYCESTVERHDPVYAREEGSEERAFCNYACLAAYIDDEGLTTGTCCEWSPA